MYIYTIEQYKNDKFMNCSYKQHVNGCGKHNIEWLKIDLKNTKCLIPFYKVKNYSKPINVVRI